jgi:hypothetical protein
MIPCQPFCESIPLVVGDRLAGTAPGGAFANDAGLVIHAVIGRRALMPNSPVTQERKTVDFIGLASELAEDKGLANGILSLS